MKIKAPRSCAGARKEDMISSSEFANTYPNLARLCEAEDPLFKNSLWGVDETFPLAEKLAVALPDGAFGSVISTSHTVCEKLAEDYAISVLDALLVFRAVRVAYR